jgi:hypothetical protein
MFVQIKKYLFRMLALFPLLFCLTFGSKETVTLIHLCKKIDLETQVARQLMTDSISGPSSLVELVNILNQLFIRMNLFTGKMVAFFKTVDWRKNPNIAYADYEILQMFTLHLRSQPMEAPLFIYSDMKNALINTFNRFESQLQSTLPSLDDPNNSLEAPLKVDDFSRYTALCEIQLEIMENFAHYAKNLAVFPSESMLTVEEFEDYITKTADVLPSKSMVIEFEDILDEYKKFNIKVKEIINKIYSWRSKMKKLVKNYMKYLEKLKMFEENTKVMKELSQEVAAVPLIAEPAEISKPLTTEHGIKDVKIKSEDIGATKDIDDPVQELVVQEENSPREFKARGKTGYWLMYSMFGLSFLMLMYFFVFPKFLPRNS